MARRFEEDFAGTMKASVERMATDEAIATCILDTALKTDSRAAVALMRCYPALDLPGLLKGAGVPVRAINSAAESPNGFEPSVENNRKHGDFEAVLMEGVGHFLMLEKPEVFNAHLRAILETLEGETR